MTDEQRKPTAFISGASRGIGRAVAVQLAEDGFDIAFCYKSNKEAAQETSDLITAKGARAYYVECDVSDFAAVQKMFEKIDEEFGGIAVVVNNAGIVIDVPLPMMKPEDWKGVIDTNLTSVFNVCRASVFSLIRQPKSSIVNISSILGIYGAEGQTNYCAAKAGIMGFSKALAKELGRYGTRVNVVAPGLTQTDMIGPMTDKMKKDIKKRITLKRVGTPEDIANMVSFLCSDKADYVTGQVLQVDGGLSV